MAKQKAVFHNIVWNTFDNQWKVTWRINGKLTNNFSFGKKRIGQKVPFKVKDYEYDYSCQRANVVCDFLNKKITQEVAVNILKKNPLCPRNAESHLLTMVSIAFGLKR